MKRRTFIKSGIMLGTASSAINKISFAQKSNTIKPVVISSGNGERATAKAMEMINNGHDALDAVIAGVNIIEDDPDDITVGLGGLPNEDGIVELDACCMHGPTHNAGGVASLRNIKNPSKVARLVMERTDHVLIVGEGALRFAKAHGFKEEELITDKSRKIWLKWKENLNKKDDWFPPSDEEIDKIESTTGTISCCAVDLAGNISGVTTTSGLSFKIPGRVGDSPIIGAGLYVDNEIGACGSTGRGEENLKNLSCMLAVEFMRMGDSPEEACLKVCKRIIKNAKIKSLLNNDGKPNFNVTFYAINKRGDNACASIYGPKKFALHDGHKNQLLDGAYLYKYLNQ
ncbi:MAG: N(4)-(beta-N-acetylglucosaminyl)-L-asparaginase [Calditrichaceae bacterium]